MFNLSLYPLTTVYQSTYYGPTKRSYLRDQFTGHIIVRGDHPDSLEKQLSAQVRTPIQYGRPVKVQEMASKYDFVVLASGQLADVPPEVGVRVDRTVQILHGIINGTFESDHLRFWWNDTLAPKGYGYMLPISDTQAMIAITSPVDGIQLRDFWPRFVNQVQKDVGFVTNPVRQESFYLVKDLSIGQPHAYI